MSDNYAIKRYHRQTVSVVGTNRNRKYLVIFVMLLLAGMAGTAYVVYSSGIFASDNPNLASRLAGRINLERQAGNLPPVQADDSLSYAAYGKAREVKISPRNYASGTDTDPDMTTNIFIIPKVTWALSGNDFQQQVANLPENAAFRHNMLNPSYRTVGIGVTSDSYNYFIVTKWKSS
jgi:uncharacterized protein YkwD